MGIKGLTKLLTDNAPNAIKEQTFESYSDRWIAIDASMSIYQFLVVIGRNDMEILTNEAGEVTSHLQGMFNRTIRLLQAGIMPVYVFDGQPPELKKQELARRHWKREDAMRDLTTAIEAGDKEAIKKFSKRTVKLTKRHNEDCKRLLRLMGVPVIQVSGFVPQFETFPLYAKAPSEAEAQCVALCKSNKVYAVASEDMDSLAFGAPRFVRHLIDPISRKIPVTEFEVPKILEELQLSMDQFVDLCILAGCDYCNNIKGKRRFEGVQDIIPLMLKSNYIRIGGMNAIRVSSSIGGQTALKLIRRYGCIEKVLQNINKTRYHIPEDWPYQEVRQLFKDPNVSLEIPELKWTAPDEEGLVDFLVNENSFNNNRVSKALEKIKVIKDSFSRERVDSLLKAGLRVPAPHKRKETRCMFHFPRSTLESRMFTLQCSMISSSTVDSFKVTDRILLGAAPRRVTVGV